jgi:hypothetical protein
MWRGFPWSWKALAMRRVATALATVALASLPVVGGRGTAHAVSADPPDFDGDGVADLAIGAQGEGNGRGVVHVLYGSPFGPVGPGSIVFGQDTPGVPGTAAPLDFFGSILAFGDYDNDGFDDLAVGAWNDSVAGQQGAGSVTVFYGSASGLQLAGQLLTENAGNTPGVPLAFDAFGAALATGDFDGDGTDDLAVGVPYDDVGADIFVGAVRIYHGGPSGLGTSFVPNWYLERAPVAVGSRRFDLFGASLAALHDGSPRDGLAVGVPGRDTGGVVDGGAVLLLRRQGVALSPVELLTRKRPSGFAGLTLAAGDLNTDGITDLAVGSPLFDDGRGLVDLVYLSANRERVGALDTIDQDTSGVPGTRGSGDTFGYSLAIVPSADADTHLYVGVPGDDVGGIHDSGAVNVFRSQAADEPLPVATIVASPSQMDAGFGVQITALDGMGDGFADVAISAPGDTVNGVIAAGSVWYYDSNDGEPVTVALLRYNQDFPGVPGAPQRNDIFGSTLAFL